MTNPVSRKFDSALSYVMPPVLVIAGKVISFCKLPGFYGDFLSMQHRIIRASVPLMQEALRQCLVIQETDERMSLLAEYFRLHIQEEQGHDEWLLQDLESIGYDRKSLLAGMPSGTIASLVGSQYYWIRHHHPLALLGYIGVLEGAPPTDAYIHKLQRATGFPPVAFRTLAKHGELDPGHKEELGHLLDTLCLDEQELDMVIISAAHTVVNLVNVHEELYGSYKGGDSRQSSVAA
jgi:hypothetical protein